MITRFRRLLCVVTTLAAMLLALAGCVPFEQQSDFQWKQRNPNYQPLKPLGPNGP
jgi:hypothetical protein